MPGWYDRALHELLRDARGSRAVEETAGLLGVAADRMADRGCVGSAALIRDAAASLSNVVAKIPVVDRLWRDLWACAETPR
jgi:hypothetical protein